MFFKFKPLVFAVLLLASLDAECLLGDLVVDSYFTTGRTQIGIVNETDTFSGTTAGINYLAQVESADEYSATSSVFASLSPTAIELRGTGFATHGLQDVPHNGAPTSSSSFTQVDFRIGETGTYKLSVDISSHETTNFLVFGSAEVQIFDVTNSELLVVFKSDEDGDAFRDSLEFDADAGHRYRMFATAGATIRQSNNTAGGSYRARLAAVPEPSSIVALVGLLGFGTLRRSR